MNRRQQKNVTMSKEQAEYAKANYGKMNISTLSKMLGLSYNKTHSNLKVMGLHVPKQDKPLDLNIGKVVKMKVYFDENEFFKYYEY